MKSFKMVSLIAIVPDSECSTPILMVSSAAAARGQRPQSASATALTVVVSTVLR